jgi:hypothetical protein
MNGSHTIRLNSSSFNEILSDHEALKRLLQIVYGDKQRAPLYLCRYEYGSSVTERRSARDYFSRFLPPCGSVEAGFEACKALMRETEGHRPLIFILSGAVEEFLEFPQVQKQGLGQDITKQRIIPLRMVHAGECVGAYEALNAFYFEDYGRRGNRIFGTPARRLAAGARSVFINAPIKELARALQGRLARPLSRYYRANQLTAAQLGAEFDRNHSKFLKMLAEAAGVKWHCDLLVIPFATLQSLVWKGNLVRPDARDLLLEIHRIGWIQSRHSRSASVRRTAIADPLARKGTNVYQEQIIHHLISVGRGEFPGFAPFEKESQAGPFQEVLEFIDTNHLAASFKCFPSILQAAHLGTEKYQRSAVYYSFAHPTLLSPLHKLHSGPDIMQELKIRLNDVKRQGRTAVKGLAWDFYISRGLSKPGRHWDIFENSTEAATDFAYQQQLANVLETLKQPPFFGPERDGFLSKFIRLYLQHARTEPGTPVPPKG